MEKTKIYTGPEPAKKKTAGRGKRLGWTEFNIELRAAARFIQQTARKARGPERLAGYRKAREYVLIAGALEAFTEMESIFDLENKPIAALKLVDIKKAAAMVHRIHNFKKTIEAEQAALAEKFKKAKLRAKPRKTR